VRASSDCRFWRDAQAESASLVVLDGAHMHMQVSEPADRVALLSSSRALSPRVLVSAIKGGASESEIETSRSFPERQTILGIRLLFVGDGVLAGRERCERCLGIAGKSGG
jgi:hypothetical protein